MRHYTPGGSLHCDSNLLPANERRRTTQTIRLALEAAEDALKGTDLPPEDLASVFASASGDLDIVDRICAALCLPDRPVSPTHFHNSVHNAPAGYWAIAAHSMAGSTTLAAYDATFSAGLMDALTHVVAESAPVLLVAYDNRTPDVLQPMRPVAMPFAAALILTPTVGAGCLARVTTSLGDAGEGETMCTEITLEALRRSNPAARALPLLTALAYNKQTRILLPYLDGQCLVTEVAPCA
jgi:hypothetical protein